MTVVVLAPEWVAPVVTVFIFVTTTALGFMLMRVGFNIRPQWERHRDRARSMAASDSAGAEKTPSGGKPG